MSSQQQATIDAKPHVTFRQSATSWNTNEVIANVLLAAGEHPEWIRSDVCSLPPSAAMIIYQRKDGGYYKQDGYLWKRRKDGKLAREDHMKLKVKGAELIYANYVHSALVPTFHRRAYWLLHQPEIILVHYLNVHYVSADVTEARPLSERIVGCIRHSLPHVHSRHHVLQQLTAILRSPLMPRVDYTEACVARLVELAFNHHRTSPPLTVLAKPTVMLIQSSTASSNANGSGSVQLQPLLVSLPLATANASCTTAAAAAATPLITRPQQQPTAASSTPRSSPSPRGSVVSQDEGRPMDTSSGNGPQTALNHLNLQLEHSPLGRSSSCSSATRKGLSSLAMCRQPSALSDSLDHAFVAGTMNAFMSSPPSGNSSTCTTQQSLVTQRTLTTATGIAHSQTTSVTYSQRAPPFVIPGGSAAEQPASVGNNAVSSTASVTAAAAASHQMRSRENSVSYPTTTRGDPNSSLDSNSNHTSNHSQSLPSAASSLTVPVADITDYSPDWAYADGGVKVLVTGPWYSRSNQYACVFGGTASPATLVQPGVLKSFCPPHEPGECELAVWCDQQVISNAVPFTYYDAQSSLAHPAHNQTTLVSGLLERLEHLEQFLVPHHHVNGADATANGHTQQRRPAENGNGLETRVLQVCERMAGLGWGRSANDMPTILDSAEPASGLSLLHVAAALNFHRLIAALFAWSQENGSAVLSFELDCTQRDANGRTPLMLACVVGATQAARVLVTWCPSSTLLADPAGQLPKHVAAHSPAFVRWLDTMTRRAHAQARRGNPAVDPTAVWVMSDGETITDHRSLVQHQDDEEPSARQAQAAAVTQGAQQRRQGTLRAQLTVATADMPRVDAELLREKQRAKRFSIGYDGDPSTQLAAFGYERATSTNGRQQSPQPSSSAAAANQRQTGVEGGDDDDQWLREPLSVDIPMDVPVPDSPELRDMWQQVTSPSAVANDDARLQFATLAQQIIDAIPDHIKLESTTSDGAASSAVGLPAETHSVLPSQGNPFLAACTDAADAMEQQQTQHDIGVWDTHTFHTFFNSTLQSEPDTFNITEFRMAGAELASPVAGFDACADVFSSGNTADALDVCMSQHAGHTAHGGLRVSPSTTTSVTSSSAHQRSDQLNDFLNHHHNNNNQQQQQRGTSPLTHDLEELKLSDREQRELYEAARIIQHAFRSYKTRVSSQQRQTETEIRAAVTIQSYYRRYKQYCYFKKLHNAALLIQKHFRLYRAAKSSTSMTGDDAAYTTNTKCIRLQVDGGAEAEGSCCWREHMAAARIQHAYRGHYMRKRQAAARKIQKFMRDSRKNSDELLPVQEDARVKRARRCNECGQHVGQTAARPLMPSSAADNSLGFPSMPPNL